MHTIVREFTLLWKLDSTHYKNANKEFMELYPEHVGVNEKAESAMLQNAHELKTLMRPILNITPDSNSSNWDEKVRYWFNSLDIRVSLGGYNLDASISYDIDDIERAPAIAKLKLKHKGITDSRKLAEHVEGIDNAGNANVPENKKYLYGMPRNPQKYIEWRYCLVNKEVADSIATMDKSPGIKFYLYSEAMQKAQTKAAVKVSANAMKAFLAISKDNDLLDNVLAVLSPEDTDKMAQDDKLPQLKVIYDTKPESLISILLDKTLITKALIERLVKSGILTRYPNTSIIVSSADNSHVIGNNLPEAITYFNNVTNKDSVDQYKTILHSYKKGPEALPTDK